MTSDHGTPRHVLAVTDESEAQIALRSAVALAEHHGARIEVLACIEPPHDLGIMARIAGRESQALLSELVARKQAEIEARIRAVFPYHELEPKIVFGKTYLEVVRHVSETGCDFVVKAAEPLSRVNRLLFASNDQHLLRKCPCPVWLQTPAAPIMPRRVLAAIDLDITEAAEPDTQNDLNRRVIEVARGLVGSPKAEVVVLHAWDAVGEGLVWAFSTGRDAREMADRYASEILKERKKAMRDFLVAVEDDDDMSPRLIPQLTRGVPEQVIEEQSRQLSVDAVVLGTVARTGLGGVFIGNTAENIINSLGCPVVAVKPDGFVSPLLRD